MKNLILILGLLISAKAISQSVGISDVTFTPSTRAVLDLSATAKGFLTPRITLNTAIDPITGTKPEGLMVYNNGGSIGSNGYYYWTGLAWTQIATESGTVSGSGTQNYVPKWNNAGGDQLGNSQIFDDGTYVGVGTSAPASMLTVYDPDESTTITNFTQSVNQAGVLVSSEYFANAYTPGVFWNTSNDNAAKPKAGIFMYQQAAGSKLLLGTSNSYATGLTNTALTIDKDGKIGIGTTVPGQSITLEGTAPISEIRSGGFLMLRPTGNGWDMRLQAVSTRLDILSGGDLANPIASFLNGGNVGIGSPSPSYPLDVSGTARATEIRAANGIFRSELRGDYYLALQGDRNMVLYDGAAIWSSGTAVSDIRTKKDIKPLEETLPTLMDLSAIRFKYKKEEDLGNEEHIGVIAQEILKYYPDMVYHDTKSDRYIVYYDKLTTLLLKGIQEQQDMIEGLQSELSNTNDNYSDLKAEIELIKKQVNTLDINSNTKAQK